MTSIPIAVHMRRRLIDSGEVATRTLLGNFVEGLELLHGLRHFRHRRLLYSLFRALYEHKILGVLIQVTVQQRLVLDRSELEVRARIQSQLVQCRIQHLTVTLSGHDGYHLALYVIAWPPRRRIDAAH